MFRGDAGYPEHLAVLPDAPDVLFVRGRLPVRPGVAIVGTRRCTRYGLGVARAYGAAAGRAGWCVVSGLARGIDGAAHRGVVDVGGIGVGVLGCGIDVAYPGEHRSLADALVEGGGALVTEYPPGTPPEGWRFPPRNRIISGLVSVVVVVEAAERGGALVTAAAALDQARVVLAVPGDVDRVSSRGCNLLIRDGAVPVLDPADLVEAVSLVLGPPHVGRIGGMGDVPVGGVDAMVLDAAVVPGAGVAEIVERCGVSVAVVLAEIARLEASGRIRREGDVLVAVAR